MASLGVARRILKTAEHVELEVGRAHLGLNVVDAAEPWEQLRGVTGDLPPVAMCVPRDEGLREAWAKGNLVGLAGPAVEALEPVLERLVAL
jgi:hypothetical protein